MIESSNTQEPVESTAVETASPTEKAQETPTLETSTPTAPEDTSLRAAMEKKAQEIKASAPDAATAIAPATVPGATPPAYQANYKYKAFGKERELPEQFRSLIKDEATEKQVKEVFTRADAFDDMKSRVENSSKEFQGLLQTHQTLDKDVKRVMNFRNQGDYDNFFAALKISDNDVFNWVQNKLAAMKDPTQLQQYNQQVQQRADLLQQQESYTNLQQNYNTQAVQARTMQLDMVLSRPDVTSTATAWDSKVGQIGAFRNLVIQEAANHWYMSGQKTDLSVEQAVDQVLKKFGKFVETQPQASSNGHSPAATAGAPQAPTAPVAPQAKPVIPNIQGKGATPVKRVPKSLDELRQRGKELRKIEEIPNF